MEIVKDFEIALSIAIRPSQPTKRSMAVYIGASELVADISAPPFLLGEI